MSKNHNSKAFVIYVHPDISLYPQNADIAGDYSTSINVKSKRTSKSKIEAAVVDFREAIK